MFFAERGHSGGSRVPIGSGPVGPDPRLRIEAMDMFIESAIDGEVFEQRAFTLEECLEAAGAWRASAPLPPQEVEEQQLERAQLERGHAFIFDKRGGAEGIEGGLEGGRLPQLAGAPAAREILQRLDIQIKVVLIKRGVGKVRAGVERAAVVDGVKRVESHEAGFQIFGDEIDDIEEIAKIAAAPVSRGADAIEADGQTGGASALAQMRRDEGAVRRDDQAGGGGSSAQRQGDLVREIGRASCR